MPNESHLHAERLAETNPSPEALGPGYEVRDTNVSAIVVFIIGLFVSMVVIQVALLWMLRAMTGETAPASAPAPATTVHVIYDQRTSLTEAEEGRKASIDKAIDALADKGIPAVAGPAKTEAEINGHAGGPVPADVTKDGKPAPLTPTSPAPASAPAPAGAQGKGGTP